MLVSVVFGIDSKPKKLLVMIIEIYIDDSQTLFIILLLTFNGNSALILPFKNSKTAKFFWLFEAKRFANHKI